MTHAEAFEPCDNPECDAEIVPEPGIDAHVRVSVCSLTAIERLTCCSRECAAAALTEPEGEQ